MSKSLVIVESPAKAKTINKYLGADFIVEATVGHIKDLPKSKIGVELENGSFAPDLIVIPGKEKVVDHLKKLAKKVDHIYLAPDPDREGEAIAAHLEEELRGVGNNDIQRVTFNEITPKAVKAAFENARKVNVNLVDAQQTRRVLDRIVGYQISPLLWDKVRRGLSAGRVQTVAVRLIVEREQEIKAFVPVEYWTIDAVLQAPDASGAAREATRDSDRTLFTARLVAVDGERISVRTVSQPAVPDGETARAIVADASKAKWSVRSVEKKERKRNPPAPFTTSKLQQEAAGRLGFGVKQTMGLAQRLYEGVEVGQEGTIGLITYMRTDSTRVSPEAIGEVRAWIGQQLGEQYLPKEPNTFKSKKDAQDAHEAIRPTHPEMHPDMLSTSLSAAELRLYRLIWQRFVASQMTASISDVTTIEIDAKATSGPGKTYNFRLSGSVLKFDGFLKVYQEADEDGEDEQKLPALEAKQALQLATAQELEAAARRQRDLRKADARRQYEIKKARIEARADDQELEDDVVRAMLPEFVEEPDAELQVRAAVDAVQKFTEPPPRYSEASLVKVLEERGIGRPSTYAAIINTIQEREYVQKVGGKRSGGFIPTEIGTVVADLLVKNFPYIFDTQYTAKLETELDDIEDGKEQWTSLLTGFYGHLKQELTHASEHMEDLKRMEKPTEEKCDLCGSPLVLKWGKFGTFYACSAYDKKVKGSCTFTKENYDTKPNLNLSDSDGDAQDKEEFCEACGRPMVLRNGRFGPFMACTAYNEDPPCKTVRRLSQKQQQKPPVPLEENCPKCGSQMVLRNGKYGEFVSCSAYPKCKYIKQNTIGMPCPKCADGEVVEKKSRFGSIFYSCTNYPKCDFTVNNKPVPGPCPECGSLYLMEKTLKSGVYLVCPNNPKRSAVGENSPVDEASKKRKKKADVPNGEDQSVVCSFTQRLGDAPEKMRLDAPPPTLEREQPVAG